MQGGEHQKKKVNLRTSQKTISSLDKITNLKSFSTIIASGTSPNNFMGNPLVVGALKSSIPSYSLEIIKKYFPELVKDQEYLSTPERWSEMLALLPGDSILY